MTPEPVSSYAIPILAALVLAIGMVMSKWILQKADTATFMFFRSLGAVGFSATFSSALELAGKTAVAYALLAVTVILVPFLMNALFFAGVRRADIASENALLQSTPVFVLLFEIVVLGAMPHPLAWIGVTAILLGIVILISTVVNAPGRIPIAFGLGAAAVNGLHFIVLAAVLTYFSRGTVILAQNVGYFVLSLMFYAKQKRMIPNAPAAAPGGLSTGWILLFSLLNGLLIQVVFLYLRATSVEHLGALATSSLVLAQLPLTVFLSHILLKDRLTPSKVASALIIVAGAIVIAFSRA